MTKIKKTALALGAACAFAFTGGIAALNTLPAVAEETTPTTPTISGFYGSKLKDPVAIAFYKELEEMATDPEGEALSEFRTGATHTVADVDASLATAFDTAVANYEKGDVTLTKQFGAALDCFRYDYADLFYVNFDLLNFNVTKSTTTPEPTTPEPSPAVEGGEETGGEEPGGEPGGGTETGGESGGTGTGGGTETGGGTGETETPAVTYTVTIGAGRAASYLLFDKDDLNGTTTTPEPTPEPTPDPNPEPEPTAETTEPTEGETNPGEGGTGTEPEPTPEPPAPTETLFTKYEAAYGELLLKAIGAVKEGATTVDELTEATVKVKDKAIAVNKVLGESFTYGFDNAYVNTTYSMVAENEKRIADSEGLARVYKALMKGLGVDSILVSGYYVKDGKTKACTWNYVKDGESWYAVDVANNMTSQNKYLYATGETFLLDHFEDGVVSLSKYPLEYPDLAVNHYDAESGALQVARGTFVSKDGTFNKEGIAVKYVGEGALEFRTKDGEVWSGWTNFEMYLEGEFGYKEPTEPTPDPTPDQTPEAQAEEGTPTEDNTEEPTQPTTPTEPTEPAYKIAKKDGIYYLFDLTDGAFEIRVVNNGACIETASAVSETFSTDKVAIPVVENDARLTPQTIGANPFEAAIKFGETLKKTEGAEVSVDFTVTSLFGTEVNEEFVKEYAKVTDLNWDSENNTLKFKFTPSKLSEHNGLRYTFTINNLVSETGAVPQTYSVAFKFDEIKANGVSVGSNLYTDIVTQPSLVFNNDLSLSGWTYDGGKQANDNMISALAMTVAKPAASVNDQISEAIKSAVAANGTLFQAGAYDPAVNASDNYMLDLSLDGSAVTIPQNSYLKLAFPYPAGHGPEDKDDVVYKVFQFKKDAGGNVDYANFEILDVVAARQGLVVAVNDISAFAIVAMSKDNVIGASSKVILTETTGIGGAVTTSSHKPVNTLGSSPTSKIDYTVTAEAGYVLESILLNGVPVAEGDMPDGALNSSDNTTVYKYTIIGNNEALTNATYNAVRFEFKPVPPEGETGMDYSLANSAASEFIKEQLKREKYSDIEKDSIIKDYPVGGAVFTPYVPPVIDTRSTSTQLIIVLSVVGGIALIGAIAIIYCGAIRPKILREREEEAERIAAQRERRANRNRPSGPTYDPRGRR